MAGPYMFEPKQPFALFDADKLRFNKDSEFLDGIVEEQIQRGGVQVNVYRLLGTFAQDRDALGIKHTGPGDTPPLSLDEFLGLEDPILGENRDRAYDFNDIPFLWGVYQVSQNDLEYAKWGLTGLTNDVLTMEFHLQACERVLGRRIIVGDVIEMPHLREVGIDGRIANKWYVVSSVIKSPGGYDPMYGFHVLGAILAPMRNAQEFIDLMEREDEYGKTLAEQTGNGDALLDLTAQNQALANDHAKITWWDTTPMYFDPADPLLAPYRWIDDGKPPNGIPIVQGNQFPANPLENDFFLRSDFYPNRLFQYRGGRWHLREIDIKREWQPYNWVRKLRDFMSDRSDADKARGYKLKSIHDVITPREEGSDPSPESDS